MRVIRGFAYTENTPFFNAGIVSGIDRVPVVNRFLNVEPLPDTPCKITAFYALCFSRTAFTRQTVENPLPVIFAVCRML